MNDQVDARRRPVALDLFSGAGGMSLGFEAAGFDVLAAVDHDPVHLATYAYNFPLTATKCADIESVKGEDLIACANEGWIRHHEDSQWDGVIDCIFGGPSCQGFSFIGKNDPSDPRNNLVFEFARLVKELQPRYFVMENVPGLLGPRHRDVVDELRNTFSKAGYTLDPNAPVRLDAASCGVPQIRRRVFIVGARRDEMRIPALGVPRVETVPTVLDALGDLPDPDSFDALLQSDAVRLDEAVRAQLDKRASRYANALRQSRFGAASYTRVWDPREFTASGRTVHTEEVIARFRSLAPGAVDHVSRLRRLSADSQSYTLRAGTGRDHGSFTSSRPIHYVCHRVITVREAARLHSFPDWFRFHITKWHGFRQVGNAVPPLLAAAVANWVREALAAPLSIPTRRLHLGDRNLLSLSLITAAEAFGFDPGLLPVDVRRKAKEMGDTGELVEEA